jgi:hypothetical protein
LKRTYLFWHAARRVRSVLNFPINISQCTASAEEAHSPPDKLFLRLRDYSGSGEIDLGPHHRRRAASLACRYICARACHTRYPDIKRAYGRRARRCRVAHRINNTRLVDRAGYKPVHARSAGSARRADQPAIRVSPPNRSLLTKSSPPAASHPTTAARRGGRLLLVVPLTCPSGRDQRMGRPGGNAAFPISRPVKPMIWKRSLTA